MGTAWGIIEYTLKNAPKKGSIPQSESVIFVVLYECVGRAPCCCLTNSKDRKGLKAADVPTLLTSGLICPEEALPHEPWCTYGLPHPSGDGSGRNLVPLSRPLAHYKHSLVLSKGGSPGNLNAYCPAKIYSMPIMFLLFCKNWSKRREHNLLQSVKHCILGRNVGSMHIILLPSWKEYTFLALELAAISKPF